MKNQWSIQLMRWSKIIVVFALLGLFIACQNEGLNPINLSASEGIAVAKAKIWYEKNSGNGEISKFIKTLDWNKAIVSHGEKGLVVEIPLQLKDDLTTKKEDSNLTTSYYRLLFIIDKTTTYKMYNVLIATNNSNFDNNSNTLNFYNLDKNFDGVVTLVNSKNEVTSSTRYSNGNVIKDIKTGVSARQSISCVFLGWWYGDNDRFVPIALVGCYGGSDVADYPLGHGAGSGGGNAGGIAQAHEDNIINKLDPCPSKILDNLKKLTNNDIAKIFKKFEPSTKEYNLTIVSGDAGAKPAVTGVISKFNYITTMSNNGYSDGTQLFKASNLLHEIIHAYFLSIVDDYNSPAPLSPSAASDFPALYSAYCENKYPGSGDVHHLEMANTYVNAIGAALQEFQTGLAVPNGAVPSQIYTDLAWGGLQDAPVFVKTFPIGSSDYIRIINRYACEGSGRTVGAGTPKAQTPIGKPCN